MKKLERIVTTLAIIAVIGSAVGLLAGCNVLNDTTVNNNQNGGAQNPVAPEDPCGALTVSVNVDLESGGNVGEPLVFSADPRDASGNSITVACRGGVVNAAATGICSVTGTPTLDAIGAVAAGPGICTMSVTYAGKTGSKSVEVKP